MFFAWLTDFPLDEPRLSAAVEPAPAMLDITDGVVELLDSIEDVDSSGRERRGEGRCGADEMRTSCGIRSGEC